MPTFERSDACVKDFQKLSPTDRAKFLEALRKFIDDLQAGGKFRKGLRVKGIKGAPGFFEMTWADDGRAVFSYAKSIKKGEPHIIWHAIGTHDVLP